MQTIQEYLLDTNAYFKVLCFLNKKIEPISEEYSDQINNIILSSNCYISEVTLIEIISVIGKYARGSSAQKDKCNCKISQAGDICQNHKYIPAKRKWKAKEVRAWIKLTKDIVHGRSPLLELNVINLSNNIMNEAGKFIEHSVRFNFGSMDAIIVATAIDKKNNGKNIAVITSDKSLKAGMSIANVACADIFKEVTYSA